MNKRMVKQSNNLNMASYNLSPLALDILHVFLSKIKKDDTELRIFKLSLNDLDKTLDKRINRKYIELATSELISNPLRIEHNSKTLKTTWCAAIELDLKNNFIELEISSKLKELLLNINNNFSLSDLTILSKLNGMYSKRIYLFLSQFSSTGYFKIDLIEFKKKLEIENKYNIYSDFKKRVILLSIKNINNILDINLKFNEIKEGRKIVQLEFIFDKIKYKKEVKRNESSIAIESWLNEDNIIDVDLVKEGEK